MIIVAQNCKNISERPVQTFHEAVQSTWFLFVILQMESNASSFSPGRLDRHLEAYYEKDIKEGNLDKQQALEIIECLWLKFNEIVYMRNSHGAKYFAGFPIGFNIAIGGQDENGNDTYNDLSFLFLEAQKHLGLPQPNLSVRLHEGTSDELLKEAVRVVAKGSVMPQFFNDKAVIQSIQELGIEEKDARDYAIVGCVELTTQGNNLGWSDSAMFNLNKALEVALTGGICLLTGEKIAPDYGNLETYETFEELEAAFKKQIDYFMDKMLLACEEVEKAHIDLLPSPFLSTKLISPFLSKLESATRAASCHSFSVRITPFVFNKFHTPTGNPGSSQLPFTFRCPEIVPCWVGIYPGISSTLFLLVDQLSMVFHLNGPVRTSADRLSSRPLFCKLPIFFKTVPKPVVNGTEMFHNRSVDYL